jgi:PD-(D/E)XK nuclease family transposase
MSVKEKYINPFTDFGFKKLFGTELNKDLLIDFLNEVILPQQRKIADLSYRSNEHLGQTKLDRKAIFDLYCISSTGERFIVEMQNFTKKEEELETTYDKWLFVLKHLPNLTDRPAKLQERIFQRLFEAAEIAKFTPEEKEQYEESLKVYRDLKNVIDAAYDEGKIEGKVEGKIEGKVEGKIEGKIEEKVENIKKALRRGKLSIEEIAEDFDTTVDFVRQVKHDHQL